MELSYHGHALALRAQVIAFSTAIASDAAIIGLLDVLLPYRWNDTGRPPGVSRSHSTNSQFRSEGKSMPGTERTLLRKLFLQLMTCTAFTQDSTPGQLPNTTPPLILRFYLLGLIRSKSLGPNWAMK